MNSTGRSLGDLVLLPLLLLAGTALWLLHAQAWDLGGRSPILNYDSAQYALAARELAWHGRLASPYALPLELVKQAQPPWPLAVVQPGLVLVEAAIFKLVPARAAMAGSDPRARLTLILPFCSYLLLGAAFALSTRHLFARWWPDAPAFVRRGSALTLGLMFLLDPEAQHFAVGGFTELPFTVGLLFALLGLALEAPHRRPFFYGLALGAAGLFRANMLWLAPLFAVAGTWSAPEGRRIRTLALVLLGFALPLAPWWFYKWSVFGSPTWDLTRYVIWDHVQGRSWFSLYHLPEVPQLPGGGTAVALLSAKVLANLPQLALDMLLGPRGLWLGGLVLWLAVARPACPLAAAAYVALVAAALGVASAALSIPWLRYLFPTRILLEPCGVLALGSLAWRVRDDVLGARARRLALAGIAVVALAWGGWCTWRGTAEASETSRERGVPSSATLTSFSILFSDRLVRNEPLMSNLGPALAWQTQHPVLHLALTPQDVDACRRRLDFRHILLVFRDGSRAWAGWDEIMEREGAARTISGLGVVREGRYHSLDGFTVVWLELAPLGPLLASDAPR